MTIFGGLYYTSPNSNYYYLNDVWELNNANGLGGTPTWTQLSPTGGPPPIRSASSAVYAAVNNRMTIFGGVNDTYPYYLNDVWVLSNANGLGGTPVWTQLSPTGSALTTRAGHTAVYDSINNRMTIFGGENHIGLGRLNDVWVLSNADDTVAIKDWMLYSTKIELIKE